MTTETQASAAASGNAATTRFRESGKTGQSADVSTERVSVLAGRIIKAANDIVLEEHVTYDEYNALKSWLIKVGEDGEWPLFLDVWLEHSVEDVATSHREGNKGSIEGPYYIPDAPQQQTPATIDMRENEPGTPLLFQGQVSSTKGTPLAGPKWSSGTQIRTASTPNLPRICRNGTCAELSSPTARDISRSTPFNQLRTRSPPTGLAAS